MLQWSQKACHPWQEIWVIMMYKMCCNSDWLPPPHAQLNLKASPATASDRQWSQNIGNKKCAMHIQEGMEVMKQFRSNLKQPWAAVSAKTIQEHHTHWSNKQWQKEQLRDASGTNAKRCGVCPCLHLTGRTVRTKEKLFFHAFSKHQPQKHLKWFAVNQSPFDF